MVRLSVTVLLLFTLSCLFVCFSLVSSQSYSVLNYCYYIAQDSPSPTWTISVSGSVTVSGPISNPAGSPSYQVVGINGVRTQTGSNPSTVFINGLIPGNTTNGYDNTIYTTWPFLSGGSAGRSGHGLGYTVSSPVIIPTTSTATTTINIVSHPINEVPLSSVSSSNAASGITGLSYLVFIPASQGVPTCAPTSAVTYSFYYYVSPIYNVTAYPNGDWSACVSGTIQVLGPFPYPSYTGSGYNSILVVVGASGSRFITAQYGLTPTTSNITGVGPDDGGDFMIYSLPPQFSNAGITFRYSTIPPVITESGIQSGNTYYYLNVWSDTGSTFSESNAPSPYQMQVTFPFPVPLTTSAVIQCPTTILTQQFAFCYYGEGVGGPSTWTVSMYGSLLAAPEISGSGHWFLTAATGTRKQTGTSASTVSITGLGPVVDPVSGFDNQIGFTYPFLSGHGIQFQLSASVNQPSPAGGGAAPSATNTISLVGDPPCEIGTCPGGNYAQGWSVLLVQPSSFGSINCGPPGTAQGLPVTSLNFGYLATPRTGPAISSNTNAAQPAYFSTSTPPPNQGCDSAHASSGKLQCPVWSACLTATLRAVGPLFLPSPTGSGTAASYGFAVYQANGTRVYNDVTGANQVTQITGMVYQDGADQVLYLSSPYVDDAGLSFALSAIPVLAYPDGEAGALAPGQTSTNYINLWSATQTSSTVGFTATEAVLTTYPDNTANVYWGVNSPTTINGVALPVQPAYVCPATLAAQVLNFCIFISSSPGSNLALNLGYSAVAYSGQFIAQPANGGSNWIVTGVTGQRQTFATSPYGSGAVGTSLSPLSTQLLSSLNSADPGIATGGNTLSQSYNLLPNGINLVVNTVSASGTVSSAVLLSNSPPVESLESWNNVDTAFTVYTAATDPSLSTCPPTNVQILSFSYTAAPANHNDDSNQNYNTNPTTGATWSSCMSGLVQVIGPYTMPAANGQIPFGRSAYIVLGAAGARTFIDVNGTAWTNWISGVNNGVGGGSNADGADMMLYTAPPYVDDAGITFDLIGVPRWPNSADPSAASGLQPYHYVNLWYQGFGDWSGATEAIPPYTPYNYATFTVAPYIPGSTRLKVCPQGPNVNYAVFQFGIPSLYNNTLNGGGSTGGSSTGVASSSSSSSNLTGGDIAGIVIGVVAAFLIAICLAVVFTMCCISPKSDKAKSSDETSVTKSSHVQLEETHQTTVNKQTV